MIKNKHFENLSGSFSATYTESAKPPRDNFHIHEAYELMLILSEGVELSVNNEAYEVPYGAVLLFAPSDLHLVRFSGNDSYKRFVVWFKDDFLNEFETVKYRLLKCFYIRGAEKANMLTPGKAESKRLRDAFTRLAEAHKAPTSDDSLWQKFLLGELLVSVNELYVDNGVAAEEDGEHSAAYSEVFAAIRFIQENFSEKITAESLEKLTGIGKRRLCEKFLSVTGMTTGQYILNYRLTSAKAYLVQGLSVAEVCEKTGFDNWSNFSRTFKNHIGISPKQYAMKHKK